MGSRLQALSIVRTGKSPSLGSLRFEPGDEVFAAGDSRLYSESARDRVTPADAREHFPERVKNAIHRGSHRIEIAVVDVRVEHFSFGGGMFAIGLEVDAEIAVVLGAAETVMSF